VTPEPLTRTFLSAYPDQATLDRLEDLLSRLRTRMGGVRWAPVHQLHFTLRFFGDLTQAQIESALGVMEKVCPDLKPAEFPLNGLGSFPDWKRPRVIWAGAGAGGEDLEEIARRLELGFREVGLGHADKPFKSHLTIGRVRDRLRPVVIETLRKEPFATPPTIVRELKLMASRLGPQGAVHSLIKAVAVGDR
jgi:2'-5' RNA ligase